MDPKLAYWTWALVNLLAVVVLALLGVRRIRRREVRAHRRFMLGAASLVVVFLLSYVAKLALLGREELARWSVSDVTILRIHELCVAAMLLGGGYAGYRAYRFRIALRGGPLPGDPPHRRGGWFAVVGGILGFATAALVLAGMYARAGAAGFD